MPQTNFMMEEDLPLLNDQEEYDLLKDILSDEVHDFYDEQEDISKEKSKVMSYSWVSSINRSDSRL